MEGRVSDPVQNCTDPSIRREDIASLAREVVRYLGAVDSPVGIRRIEPFNATEGPNLTATATSAPIVPPPHAATFTSPVLIPTVTGQPNVSPTNTTNAAVIPPQNAATSPPPAQIPVTGGPVLPGVQPPHPGTWSHILIQIKPYVMYS